MNLLTLEHVSYRYEQANKDVLKDVNATFEAGKIYAIVGKSGSGKSTALSLIAGLDTCKEGNILYQNKNLATIDRDQYRAKDIGVIFQGFNLLTNATALQNIVLSMHISDSKEKDRKAFALNMLNQVGIDEEKANRKTLKLSGGEQQRVGIARALASNPELVIADEPTGNLDRETEAEILDIFTRLTREEGKCVIIVTHSKKVADIADVVYHIEGGKMSA